MLLHGFAPPLLGWLMGALVPIEPDHLCSLMAINAGKTNPWGALREGGKWGLGHAMGMILFCLIFLLLQRSINLHAWEYFGNYVAGALLIGIGVYFWVCEWKYLEELDDGQYRAKKGSCDCCGHGHGAGLAFGYHHGDGHAGHGESEVDSEALPLLPTSVGNHQRASGSSATSTTWDLKGVFVGLLQGLCCPSCLAGMAFVGQLGVQQPSPLDVVSFLLAGICSIIICSSIVSAVTTVIAAKGGAYFSLSARTVYQVACFATIAVGASWIVLNATGHLQAVHLSHRIVADHDAEEAVGGSAVMSLMSMH